MEQVAAPQQLAAKDTSWVSVSFFYLLNYNHRIVERTVPALGTARKGIDSSAPILDGVF